MFFLCFWNDSSCSCRFVSFLVDESDPTRTNISVFSQGTQGMLNEFRSSIKELQFCVLGECYSTTINQFSWKQATYLYIETTLGNISILEKARRHCIPENEAYESCGVGIRGFLPCRNWLPAGSGTRTFTMVNLEKIWFCTFKEAMKMMDLHCYELPKIS